MYASHLKLLNTTNQALALRIEWCKARARAQRWLEEVQLLSEEMRRVLVFLQWKVGVWKARASFLQKDLEAAESSTDELLGSGQLLCSRIDGVQAYAYRQASIQQSLHDQFKVLWSTVPLLISRNGWENSSHIALDLV
jgi:hypothetical protein